MVGSQVLINYLINFARSFIYTTALPEHCVDAILHAYQLLIETDQKDALQKNIAYFYSKTSHIKNCVKSQSAIHSFRMGSNEQADRLEKALAEKDMHVRVLKSPTVKHMGERVRVSIHSFNEQSEIDRLVDVLEGFRL